MSDPATWLQRATEAWRDGRTEEAIAAYRQLLAIAPDLPDSWYNLGLLLRSVGRFEEALDAYQSALARGVGGPEEVHLNRAVIFADHLRREADAERELRAALACDGDYAPAWLNLGNLFEEFGRRDEAIACYERILPATGGRPGPHVDCRYDALARLAHLRPPEDLEDPFLKRLEEASAAALVGPETRANLFFELGRALDRLGAYDRAFIAFTAANRCVRDGGPAYDRRRIAAAVDALTRVSLPASRRPGGGRPRVVFICGMFRSGSTLVEQALAAHPLVTAGGELNLLNRLEANELRPYPETLSFLSEERAQSIGDSYRGALRRLFPQSVRDGAVVTDKRPDNFLRIGMIRRLFPDAKIVHTVRDPADTCLSVFFQHIDPRAAGYSTDLADIAHYFGEYRRMMRHWRETRADDIFDFDYDRFVREPEGALRELLAFLDLPWEAGCLEFHAVANSVKTASYWQVRQPLYRGSSGRSRNYEKHIAPLRAALADAGVGSG
jgi:tetratricopeptide (TPR) repeat protein